MPRRKTTDTLGVAVWLSALLTSGTQAAVMGRDTMERIPAEVVRATPEYRQTGIFSIRRETFGNGIVLGANCDVVLTNAHNVRYTPVGAGKYGGRIGSVRANGVFDFVPDPGYPHIRTQGSLVVSGYDGINSEASYKSKAANDWAILRLAKPALKCEPIQIAYNQRTCDGELVLPVVQERYEDGLYRNRKRGECKVTATTGDRVLHNCDTRPGSSGAPLLCRDSAGKLSLFAINDGFMTYVSRNYRDPVPGGIGRSYSTNQHQNCAVPIAGKLEIELRKELAESAKRAGSL